MARRSPDIAVVRAYDARTEGTRGRTFLVDGMWPRGVKKENLNLDEWLRDIAPSRELRQWFGHRPERWEEFRRRYLQELEKAPAATETLIDAASEGPVTLLYSSKDTEHNNAIVLREYLEERFKKRG